MSNFKSCITISLVEEARGGPFVLWGDLREGIETAGRIGFDAIEIFPPGPEAIDAKSLTPMLQDQNLSLAAVGTGAGWVKHRLTLADGDTARRQKAVDFVRSIIDVAGPLGASTIIGSMQGRSDEHVSREAALDYLRQALETLGNHAAQYNVPLFYEPLNRYETNQVNTVAAGVRLLKSLSTENVRLLCDLFHMNIEEVSTSEALLAGGKHVGHIHFVDSNRRPVGDGQMQYASIIRALRAIEYDGYLSAEAFPYPTPEAAAEQTMNAFRYWTCAPS
jgi:sugar phosphate isomerase/epimerase